MSVRNRCLAWLGVWLLTGLSACGWQLQGARRVPEHLSPLYLDMSDGHSPFAQALSRRLREAGVTVTADRSRAQAVLSVSNDGGGHNVSSVSALNEPQQYEVFYNVSYRLDLHGADKANVLPPQTFGAVRTMSYDRTLALAKLREELALRDMLATELADQLLRRMSMLSGNGGAQTGGSP